MYYTCLDSKQENEETLIFRDFFGVETSVPSIPSFSENSMLKLINTKVIPLNKKDKLLLLNPELATWCFLEEKEKVLWEYLRDGALYSSLLTIDGLGRAEYLDNLLKNLYQRGMLSTDGETAVKQDIYLKGPFFMDIPMVEFLLTNRCNLQCSYCFAWDGMGGKDIELQTALKVIDHLIESASNHLHIKYNGGEPLLRKDLLEAITQYTISRFQKVKKKGYLLFEVTTNGTLINDEAIELFRRYNMRVLISLDGPEIYHDRVRTLRNGADSCSSILEGIRRVQDAGYPFRTITVVGRHNVSHPEEIIDFFSKQCIRDLRFNIILRHGRGQNVWGNEGINPDEYLSFMKSIAIHLLKKDELHEDNIESMLRNMVYKTRDFKCMRSPCGAGDIYLCIDPWGDIFPCALFRAETTDLLLGNIHDGLSFERTGRRHQVIKDFPSRIVDQIEDCRGCDWRHLCEGGCTLGAYLKNGTIFAPTYLCDYYKGMYLFLFDLLAENSDFISRLLKEGVKLVKV